MMSLCPIQNLEYYDELAEEDYYNDGGEPPGIWAGKAALLLKLRGEVSTEDYYNIMRGFSPKGEALCQNAGDKHRPGFDLCFSPPKSMSVLWARAEPELRRILQQAHHQAVLAAIAHFEAHATMTRRGNAEQGLIHEKALGLVVATYEHSTSRALDPQLHTHALVANIAPRTDGTWGTLESRYLFLWQSSATSCYRAELAFQLRQLGFELEPYQDTFQVVGVPQSVCEHFSTRSKDIRQALDAAGVRSGKSKVGDVLVLDTREKKAQVDRPKLLEQWQTEMDEQGFTLACLQALQQDSPTLAEDELIFDETAIAERVGERLAVFRKQDVYRAAGDLAQLTGHNAQYVETVTKRLLESDTVVDLGRDTKRNQVFTTQAVIEAEREMIDHAKALAKHEAFSIEPKFIEAALATMAEQGVTLSDEQVEAVMSACTSSSFAIQQGSAGAGKTTSLNVVRTAYQQAGFTVLGAATAKLAANNLAEEAGIETMTIARLLIDIEQERSPLNAKSVLLVDEAGQLGSDQLASLLRHAREVQAKVVLTGEDKQLDAVTRGGALRYLSRPNVLGTSRIETIRRQRESWARAAVMQLRDGLALDALQAHDAQGLVHFACDSKAAREQLIEQYQQFRQSNPDKQAVVLAQHWADVEQLSKRIRQLYQADGLVSKKSITLPCHVADRMIRFEFALGERVRLTKNDYRREFSNGTLGTITGLTQLEDGTTHFTIRCDDGRTLSFNSKDYCNEHGHVYLAQAYALTTYASQGITVDGSVFVLHNVGMDRATAYVSGSRHKDNCHWFFNQSSIEQACNNGETLTQSEALEAVSKLMSEDSYKSLAIEHLEAKHAQERQLEQELALEAGLIPELELELDW
jgi:conjugative relaxase-like TrwC/TraI family protein